jgi:hypothetical protein
MWPFNTGGSLIELISKMDILCMLKNLFIIIQNQDWIKANTSYVVLNKKNNIDKELHPIAFYLIINDRRSIVCKSVKFTTRLLNNFKLRWNITRLMNDEKIYMFYEVFFRRGVDWNE